MLPKQITFVNSYSNHVKFLVCYPNYAYLPPSILDLKAHDMKCHHVEHVGNMLPFDFFPKWQAQLVFFFQRHFLMFMVSCEHVHNQKLNQTWSQNQLSVSLLATNKSTSSPHKNCRTRCGNKGNRQMQWHMAAWSMLVWNAVRRMLEIATTFETVFFFHGQKQMDCPKDPGVS